MNLSLDWFTGLRGSWHSGGMLPFLWVTTGFFLTIMGGLIAVLGLDAESVWLSLTAGVIGFVGVLVSLIGVIGAGVRVGQK